RCCLPICSAEPRRPYSQESGSRFRRRQGQRKCRTVVLVVCAKQLAIRTPSDNERDGHPFEGLEHGRRRGGVAIKECHYRPNELHNKPMVAEGPFEMHTIGPD